MALTNINYNPKMTRYLAEKKAFDNNKLVVVDVGARYGGEQHWNAYGDQIALIGFEADEAECRTLNEKFGSKGDRYFPVALHRDKGKRTFYVTEFDASSGFYQNDMTHWSRFDDSDCFHLKKTLTMETIDFDTFIEEQKIEHVDFMKLDIEGAELDVLEGSRKYLKKKILLGAAIEVRFFESARQPVFCVVDSFMRQMGFRIFDMEYYRRARAALPEVLDYIGMPTKKGQPVFADILYLRDAVAEITSPNKKYWDDTSILKLASLFEVYGLSDCAIELLQAASKNGFLKDWDLTQLIALLTPQFGGQDIPYDEYVKKIKAKEKPAEPSMEKPIEPILEKPVEPSPEQSEEPSPEQSEEPSVVSILWKDLKLIGSRVLPGFIKRFVGKKVK